MLDTASRVIKSTLDYFKSSIDVDSRLVRQFGRDRLTSDYQGVFEEAEPLVSVCVRTYNRAKLLSERCLPSIVSQTYENTEIIVVGDGCTDDTDKRIRGFSDKRLHYVNLPSRGHYPTDPKLRWMVAGTQAANHALSLATGSFITHLDDDDEYMADRIEELVTFVKQEKLELAWHPFYMQDPDYNWYVRQCPRFEKGSVTTSSCFYHRWFKAIPWDIDAYKFREPGDWNRFRKFKYLGVKAARYPGRLLKHFRERSQ